MRLKEEYKDYTFTYNGATYITTTLKEENYKRIWDVNPELRYLFEEDKEKEFFDNKPEGITEEEYFNETIKKAVKKKTTTKKK